MGEKRLDSDLNEIITADCIDLEQLDGSSIVITGATGFIGHLIVFAFMTAIKTGKFNFRIYAFVRDTARAEAAFKKFKEEFNRSLFFYEQKDISDEISAAIHCDYIIHCAAVTHSKDMIDRPVETITSMINGTANMLNLAKREGVKAMVYLSSMEVYGERLQKPSLTESDLGYVDLQNVRSSYPEAKRLSELLCTSYSHEYNVNVKIARLAATFGAGIGEHENRVFAQFARSIRAGEDVVLHTTGEKSNSYCYTTDAVTAILMLLTRGESGEVYNIADKGVFGSIRELAEAFVRAGESIGNTTSKIVIDIPQKSMGYAPVSVLKMDSSKIEALGWKPDKSLDIMAARLLQSLTE